MTEMTNQACKELTTEPKTTAHPRIGRLAATCLLVAGIGLAVSGCSGFRKAIGEEKSSPDEFEVVVRPPLSLPPNFFASSSQLTEATPGAGEDSPTDARSVAAAELGSVEGAAGGGYEAVFNFASVPDNIREIVDEETYGIRFEKRVPLQRLFGGLPELGPVVDKFEEDQRIRRNMREGQFLTEGGTPATVPQFDESVIVGN